MQGIYGHQLNKGRNIVYLTNCKGEAYKARNGRSLDFSLNAGWETMQMRLHIGSFVSGETGHDKAFNVLDKESKRDG